MSLSKMSCLSKYLNVLSKVEDMRLEKNINNMIYYFRIVVLKAIILDLTKCIYCLSQTFYKKYILNNKLFTPIAKCRKSEKNNQIFYILYYYMIEEFFYIFTYEDRDKTSNLLLEQVLVITKFAEINNYCNFFKLDIFDWVLMIRSKSKEILQFQIKYSIVIISRIYFRIENEYIINYHLNKLPLANQIDNQQFFDICFPLLFNDKLNFRVQSGQVNIDDIEYIFKDKSGIDKKFKLINFIDKLYQFFVTDNKYYSKDNIEIISKYLNENDTSKQWRILM